MTWLFLSEGVNMETGWNIVQGYANSVRDLDEQPSNESYNFTFQAIINHFADLCSHHTTTIQKCFIGIVKLVGKKMS